MASFETPTQNSSEVKAPSEPRGLPNTLRAMRHRNFQLFFSGQLISLVGTWMQSVAQSWLVYKMTGSSLLLGSVGFASQFPVFLASPLGGIVADRYNRHRVVIATQTASMVLAFVLAVLTLTHRVTVTEIFALAILLGLVNAFDLPGRQSFLVEMVGRDDLMNAIALNSSMFNGARVVGPAIAGILVAKIGEGWCFFTNAVSYIAVIIGLLLMNVTPRPIRPMGSALAHVVEGFRFVRHTAPIRDLLLLVGLVSLVAMPYTVLMPIFADKILHGGARVTLACAGFGLSLIAFALSRIFWLSAALLVPAGFCMMLQMSSSNTLIQSMVRDELRGRVMSVYAMSLIGLAPFGALFAGAFADRVGAPVTVIMGAVACLGGAAIFGLHLPKIRDEARRLIVAQQLVGGEPAGEMTAPIEE